MVRNKIYKSLIFIFYFLSFFILLFCIKVRLTPHLYINTDFRLILLTLVCVFIYINGFILVKKFNHDKRILRINLIIYFLIYIITICTLTLFDEIFGRNGLIIIKWDKELLNFYLKYSFNIVPFKTINLFVSGYFNGIVSLKNFSVNVLGNLCAFMPFAIFLPLIFESMNKYSKFLVTMIIIVIIIEILQFVTMSGSCDIDDLILNVFGASIVYFICKISVIRSIIRCIFLFE